MKNFEVSSLNQRITIQKRTLIKDEACNEIEGWSDYYSCYSAVLDTKTNVETTNSEQQSKQQVTFVARSCKKLSELICNAKNYRVVFNGYKFNILTADNYGYTHDKFRIVAVVDDE